MNNSNENLIIYQKYLDLIYYTNDLLKKYPKCERFTLVSEIKQALYSGFKSIIYAQKEYNKQTRLKFLNQLDMYLKLQKVYIRLSFRYKYISNQNYETWSKKITDISNMLGAWIKTCLTH